MDELQGLHHLTPLRPRTEDALHDSCRIGRQRTLQVPPYFAYIVLLDTTKLVKNESVASDSVSQLATIRDSSRLESDDSIVI